MASTGSSSQMSQAQSHCLNSSNSDSHKNGNNSNSKNNSGSNTKDSSGFVAIAMLEGNCIYVRHAIQVLLVHLLAPTCHR